MTTTKQYYPACNYCKGSGFVLPARVEYPNSTTYPCPKCNGTGNQIIITP